MTDLFTALPWFPNGDSCAPVQSDALNGIAQIDPYQLSSALWEVAHKNSVPTTVNNDVLFFSYQQYSPYPYTWVDFIDLYRSALTPPVETSQNKYDTYQKREYWRLYYSDRRYDPAIKAYRDYQPRQLVFEGHFVRSIYGTITDIIPGWSDWTSGSQSIWQETKHNWIDELPQKITRIWNYTATAITDLIVTYYLATPLDSYFDKYGNNTSSGKYYYSRHFIKISANIGQQINLTLTDIAPFGTIVTGSGAADFKAKTSSPGVYRFTYPEDFTPWRSTFSTTWDRISDTPIIYGIKPGLIVPNTTVPYRFKNQLIDYTQKDEEWVQLTSTTSVYSRNFWAIHGTNNLWSNPPPSADLKLNVRTLTADPKIVLAKWWELENTGQLRWESVATNPYIQRIAATLGVESAVSNPTIRAILEDLKNNSNNNNSNDSDKVKAIYDAIGGEAYRHPNRNLGSILIWVQRTLGGFFNADGTPNPSEGAIRQRQWFEKATTTAEQYGLGWFGSQGLLYKRQSNRFKNGQVADGGWEACFTLPQLMAAYFEDLARSLGQSDASALALPVDGRIKNYPNLVALLIEIHRLLLQSHQLGKKDYIASLNTQAQVNEIIGAIGAPTEVKSIKVIVDGVEKEIPFNAISPDWSINKEFGNLLTNIAAIQGRIS